MREEIISGTTLADALTAATEEIAAKEGKGGAVTEEATRAGEGIVLRRAPGRIALDAAEDETRTDAQRGPKELLPWGR